MPFNFWSHSAMAAPMGACYNIPHPFLGTNRRIAKIVLLRHQQQIHQLRRIHCASLQRTSALGLSEFLNQHRILQRPAAYNQQYSVALEEFTQMAVMAYECGISEDTLLLELRHQQGDISDPAHDAEVEMCLQDLAIVWLTLDAICSIGESNMAAKSPTRWARGPAASDLRKAHWSGFVRMIVDGYFKKRWAWYPIDRLQLELRITAGRQEAPADVAQWAGIVYATLHKSSPLFPSM
eukprot:jgi/Botrbrau1/12731/Bobra.67_1s0091.2